MNNRFSVRFPFTMMCVLVMHLKNLYDRYFLPDLLETDLVTLPMSAIVCVRLSMIQSVSVSC